MPYRVEVHTVSCAPGSWSGNAVKHDTAAIAEEAARDLFMRWTAVKYWRVVDETGAVQSTNETNDNE